MHMHTQAQRCTREEWSWASEPEGLTVRGGFYMHRCNLMVQNYISLCGPCWEEKNHSSTSYSPSQLASTILANPAVEWQVHLVTQVERDSHYTMLCAREGYIWSYSCHITRIYVCELTIYFKNTHNNNTCHCSLSTCSVLFWADSHSQFVKYCCFIETAGISEIFTSVKSHLVFVLWCSGHSNK